MSEVKEAVKEGAKKMAEKTGGKWGWYLGVALLLIVAIVGGYWAYVKFWAEGEL